MHFFGLQYFISFDLSVQPPFHALMEIPRTHNLPCFILVKFRYDIEEDKSYISTQTLSLVLFIR
jgi:hypothetical protein